MSEAGTAFDNYATANAFNSYAAEHRRLVNVGTAIGAAIGGAAGFLIAEETRVAKPWMGAVALAAVGAFFLRRQAETAT